MNLRLTSRSVVPRMVGAAALTVAAFGVAPAWAPAAARCVHPTKGRLADDGDLRLWHTRGRLFGCSVLTAVSSRVHRLGGWSSQSVVRVDGDYGEVVWTMPVTRSGRRSDRLWAYNLFTLPPHRWVAGEALVPASASAPRREGRLQRIALKGAVVAWVTTAGDVGLAVESNQAWSFGAPVRGIGIPDASMKRDGNRLLVGSWTTLPARDLARTLTITSKKAEGESSCDGTTTYTVTVRPDPAQPPVGATLVETDTCVDG